MKKILNFTFDAIIAINKSGIITIFNRAAQQITGVKAADALGKPREEVIPDFPFSRVLLTGEPELNKEYKLKDYSLIVNQVPLLGKQGEISGAMIVFQDISQVKKLTRQVDQLKKTGSLLEAILYATEDAITVVNEEGTGILINPAYTKITGLSEADVINKHASVAVTEGESVHLKVLKTRQQIRGVRLKMGPMKKEVIVNVAPVMVEGKLRGSVGVIHDISEIMRLSEELAKARKLIRHLQAKYTFEDIIGESELVKLAVSQARHAADTPATILLRGESGTGKEMFAHAIHNASGRSQGTFVGVNCVAIAENLLESELFGYEEGAFTGAVRGGKKGYFEEADGGTIFLDEIGDIDLPLQAKLLRVLQEKEITRVGSAKPVPVNVRVIAATNANLEQRIKEGTFREDLYYRLNVVPIFIPPLRARKEDIPILADHLYKKLGQEYKRKVAKIALGVIDIFMEYDWPGNARELENIVGRSLISMNPGEEVVRPQHIPLLKKGSKNQWQNDQAANEIMELPMGKKLGEILDLTEKEVLRKTLEKTGGNKTKAAELLGIAVRSLYYKLEKHKLPLNN